MTFRLLQDHCRSSRVIVLAVPQTQSHTPRTFLAQGFFTCYIFCQKQISPRYLHGSLPYPFLVVAQMSSYQRDPCQITLFKIETFSPSPQPHYIPYLSSSFFLHDTYHVMYYIFNLLIRVHTECLSPS